MQDCEYRREADFSSENDYTSVEKKLTGKSIRTEGKKIL